MTTRATVLILNLAIINPLSLMATGLNSTQTKKIISTAANVSHAYNIRKNYIVVLFQ